MKEQCSIALMNKAHYYLIMCLYLNAGLGNSSEGKAQLGLACFEVTSSCAKCLLSVTFVMSLHLLLLLFLLLLFSQ